MLSRLLIATAFLLAPSAFADDASEAVDPVVSEHGLVRFAAQPNEQDLANWAEAGVSTIINLRPASEMADVDLDEPASVEALGMSYVSIPMPREAYTPDTVQLISQALEAAEGQVVLHCTIGWRASHSYTAYLIESGQMTPEEAVELNLWPRDGINADMMRRLSPTYAAAFPE